MANPSRLEKVQITANSNSATATKVNVQETNGEVNTQAINSGFNKNIGLGSGDVVGANTILNQYATTPTDWIAQAYLTNIVVFYGGKQWLSKSATVAGDVPGASSKWEEITFESLANKTVTVDQTIIDGSTNAVSSNAVFDGLALKADVSQLHNPVTIGTANGLSLSTQQLSLGLASSGVTGALSGTDWTAFNGKFPTPTGLTTNYLPKWNGSGFWNSIIFDNGTNVGIGTTTPGAKLEVSGGNLGNAVSNTSSILKVKANDQGLFMGALNGTPNYGSWIQVSREAFDLQFPLMLQPNGGNVGIGTTTDNGVDKVQVNGTISASPATTANQVVVKSQLDAVARPYKVYVALLSQTGTNAPTATVLENTLGGTVVWTRTATGTYLGTLNGVFTIDKTFCTASDVGQNANAFTRCRQTGTTNAFEIITTISGAPNDSLLAKTSIEVRVYL